jgi:hypothetical protein
MPDWQPIETAPKDGTPVVLFTHPTENPVVGYWIDLQMYDFPFTGWTTGWKTSSGYNADWDEVYNPTHWLPLLPLPSV